jgi:ABC-type Fe3+ transport system substrate-binding protein
MRFGARRVGAALLLALVSCGDARERLVVRTDLPEPLREVAERTFEASEPDIDVRFSVRSLEETLEELGDPDAEPAFDVWWGAPAGEAERALREGRVRSWEPILETPFVIAFDLDRVGIPDAPADWLDLFHHGWFEEVALPDPRSSDRGAAFVTAVVADRVRAADDSYIGFEWLGRLDRQVVRYPPDVRETLRALRLGQVSLVIAPRAEVEAARPDWEGRLYYVIPESGVPALVRVVAITATAGEPDSDAAARFAEHVRSSEVLTAAKLHTRWEPVGPWDEGRLPDDFELDRPWTTYPLAVDLAVDSGDVWLERWNRDVRGRGK